MQRDFWFVLAFIAQFHSDSLKKVTSVNNITVFIGTFILNTAYAWDLKKVNKDKSTAKNKFSCRVKKI